MVTGDEISKLADRTAPDRCFVSAYLNRGDETWLEKRLREETDPKDPTELELENLGPTFEMLRDWLDEHRIESKAIGLFACWAADYLEAVEIDVPVERRLVVDSSPFVLPLAEIDDEYENWCVVLADHGAARIFEVTGLEIDEVDRAAGNIKNSVKVGGWSQQRYERRRLKQIADFCDEIADRLRDLVDRGSCDRLVLAGDEQLMAKLEDGLPMQLSDRLVGSKRLRRDLSEREVFEALEPVYEEAERESERALVEAIQERRFRDGRAAVGREATLDALRDGRVQALALEREADLRASRCRDCEWLTAHIEEACPNCGGETFEVDLANEMVELAERTGARVEIAEGVDRLRRWGGVAALLRY